jgi:hypothetical protein
MASEGASAAATVDGHWTAGEFKFTEVPLPVAATTATILCTKYYYYLVALPLLVAYCKWQ